MKTWEALLNMIDDINGNLDTGKYLKNDIVYILFIENSINILNFPDFLKNIFLTACKNRRLFRTNQKIKWPYPLLHPTHALGFQYGNRYCQYLLPYQKVSAWVVCRRRYVPFIFWFVLKSLRFLQRLKIFNLPGISKHFVGFSRMPKNVK